MRGWRLFSFALMTSMPVLLGACQSLSGLSDLQVQDDTDGTGGKDGTGGADGTGGTGGKGGAGGSTSSSGVGGGGGSATCGDSVLADGEHCGFKAAAYTAVGEAPTGIVAANFSGDTSIDLAVSDASGGVSLYEGDGNGNFAFKETYKTTGTISDLQAFDINGDGSMDIFAANAQDGSLMELINSGMGDFSFELLNIPNIGAAGTTMRIAIGDVDGTEEPDLVVASRYPTSKVTIHLSDVNPPYLQVSESVLVDLSASATSDPFGLALFPLDNDAKSEIVFADLGLSTVTAYPEPMMGSSNSSITLQGDPGPVAIATADIDGDGNVDVITANSVGHTVSVIRNSGGSLIDLMDTFPVNFEPIALLATDMNRDTIADVVTVNKNNNLAGVVNLLLNDGQGELTQAVTFDVGPKPNGVAAGDFNQDGLMDLAVTSRDGNNFAVLIAAPL